MGDIFLSSSRCLVMFYLLTKLLIALTQFEASFVFFPPQKINTHSKSLYSTKHRSLPKSKFPISGQLLMPFASKSKPLKMKNIADS